MPPKKNYLYKNTKKQIANKSVRDNESEEEHQRRLDEQSQRQRELRKLESHQKTQVR